MVFNILKISQAPVSFIRKKFFDKLPEPSEEEEDMLDLAWGLTHTSRLGCQIIIDETHEGMKVKVPSGTRNMSID